MSPRNDCYLSLCLEQAALSPLHYRHGCVVVRGGKVIGQGYNDHRSQFDGRSERLASSSAYNSPAFAALKQRKNRSSKTAIEECETSEEMEQKPNTYPAYGGSNGHSVANAPLSMHSEMMAIHSALLSSNIMAPRTSKRSTQWLQKPHYKLSCRGKRDLPLQNLEAYVSRAIAEGTVTREKAHAGQQCGGVSQAQESQFGTYSSQRGRGGGEGVSEPGARVREPQEEEKGTQL